MEPPKNYDEAYFCGRNYELIPEFRLDSKRRFDVIVDLGHTTGLTLKASKRFTKIIAVEPNPLAYVKLRYNLIINNTKNVTIVPAAIRSFDGYTDLYIRIRRTIESTSVYDTFGV